MYAVSAAFKTALRNSHLVVNRVEVLSSGQVIATLPGKVLTGSNVTAVKGQPIRRSCLVRLIDDTGTLTPTDANALLAPYGNELRLWRGIRFADGTQEIVSLGIFEITDCRVLDGVKGASMAVEVSGVDRADVVSRNTLGGIYTIAAGTNLLTAISTPILTARPGTSFDSPAFPYLTPLLVYRAGDDVWAKGMALAAAHGAELFFNVNGVCVLQFEPNPATQGPSTNYIEGPTAQMTDIERKWTNRSVPNNIIREGHGTGVVAPVRATAKDTNPSSPTCISGKYGTVTDFQIDSNILTVAQAQAAADAALRLVKGRLEQLQLHATPHPALDISDVVRVTRAKLGVDSLYVIDAIKMPLAFNELMHLTLRRVIA